MLIRQRGGIRNAKPKGEVIMVTFVGNREDFAAALKELVELDYAAVDAYETAIERVDNLAFLAKLGEFKQDHERHIIELSRVLKAKNLEAPGQCDWSKEVLSTGKVLLGYMVGDYTILNAMKSNEADSTTAYERMNDHKNKWPEAGEVIKRGLQDQKRHKAWLDTVLS
jgi:hypothetical protein